MTNVPNPATIKRLDTVLRALTIVLMTLAVVAAIVVGIVIFTQQHTGVSPTPRETEGGDFVAAAAP